MGWFKCKHKFLAVESFVYKSAVYNRIIIYQCKKCDKYMFSSRWAFMEEAGALDNYFPEDEKYVSSGDMSGTQTDEVYRLQAMGVLAKYFQVDKGVIKGTRIA
jgi:hypothetical protein